MCILSPRLELRPFSPGDCTALHEVLGRVEVMADHPAGALSLADCGDWIDAFIQCQQQRGYSKWALIERASGRLIGYAGFAPFSIEEREEIELGYRLHPDVWGRGLASEVAWVCIASARQQQWFSSLYARVNPANPASRAVLVKLGFELQGLMSDGELQVELWRLAL